MNTKYLWLALATLMFALSFSELISTGLFIWLFLGFINTFTMLGFSYLILSK